MVEHSDLEQDFVEKCEHVQSSNKESTDAFHELRISSVCLTGEKARRSNPTEHSMPLVESGVLEECIADKVRREANTISDKTGVNSGFNLHLPSTSRSVGAHGYVTAEKESGEKPGKGASNILSSKSYQTASGLHLHLPSYQNKNSQAAKERDDSQKSFRFHGGAVQISAGPAMTVNIFTKTTSSERKVKPKKRYVITNSKKRLDESNISMLSSRLGHIWTALARRLGFHSGDIDRIEYDNRSYGLREVIWRFLTEWRERNARDATLCAIADALIDLKLYEIAQELKE